MAASNNRYGYFQKLLINWVRVHRPDVVRAALEEADKKYPRTATRMKEPQLPASLRGLK